jgi:hypothetical protein
MGGGGGRIFAKKTIYEHILLKINNKLFFIGEGRAKWKR